MFTISDKSFEGIVIAPLFLTVPSKEVWIPKLRSNPVKLILFVLWSAVKSLFPRIGWDGREATALLTNWIELFNSFWLQIIYIRI